MKKLLNLIIVLFILIFISSCEIYSYPTTQDDIYIETDADIVRSNVDFNIIISNGTPYYYNGNILYYFYNDIYYYPYYYDNYWYIRAYRHPFNHISHYPYFRPHRYDYRFNYEYRPNHNWYRQQYRYYRQPNMNTYRKPNGSRPDIRSNRPNRDYRGRHPSTVRQRRNYGRGR